VLVQLDAEIAREMVERQVAGQFIAAIPDVRFEFLDVGAAATVPV